MGKQSEKSSKNETEKRICAERKRVAPPPVICRRYPSVGWWVEVFWSSS